MVAVNTSSMIRASVSSSSAPGNRESFDPAISGDGRFITFQSTATTLYPITDNGLDTHIYLRDTLTGTTQFVSFSFDGTVSTQSTGLFANGPSVSDDGRYVTFTTNNAYQVANDSSDGTYQVFVRDMWAGTTVRLSQDTSGQKGDGSSFRPQISGDGRYVVYFTEAGNIIPGDGTVVQKVVRYDTLTRQTELVSINKFGQVSTGYSSQAALSQDGRFVAFSGGGSDLPTPTPDTNSYYDIFLRDMENQTTIRVSLSASNVEVNGDSFRPVVSGDGRYVAFASDASNLVSNDNNNARDVFVRDTVLGTTKLISVSANGVNTGNSTSDYADISEDGRYVVFTSSASDIVPAGNGVDDIFLRDTVSETTVCLSVGLGGATANGDSSAPQISADGRTVTFQSNASNLTPGDSNVRGDVFRISLAASEGADYLIGSNKADTIAALGGSDIINGGLGADGMTGGAGNDTFYVDNAGDKIVEAVGGGKDAVIASASFSLGTAPEVETLKTDNAAGTAAIGLTGSNTANTLIGNAGANALTGGGGADIMQGLGGNDTYSVDNAADKVVEAAGGGSDKVFASVTYALAAGCEVEALYAQDAIATTAINLTGNEFGQVIQGNRGVNALAGGGGNDNLYGLFENDTLTGGAGNDNFYFNTPLGYSEGFNLDHITDFANVSGNNDTIRLDKTIFAGLGTGGLVAGTSFAANGGGTANANTQAQIIYNTATGALVYDSNGSAAGGATQFAAIDNFAGLTGAQALSASDFIVY